MMSYRQYQAALDALNGTARSVFDVTPIEQAWTINVICAELRRQGKPLEYRNVHGCLLRCVEVGLVKQPHLGEFRRAPYRPAPTIEKVEKEPEMPLQKIQAAPEATPRSVFDIVSDAAAALRALGANVKEVCDRAAKELDDAALATEEEAARQKAELHDIAQLKTLLGKFSGGAL